MNGKKSSIHFLVHESGDTVAVATVDLEAGAEAQGLTMDTHSRVEVRVLEDIPLGHKIALQDHKAGAGVIKYGHDIGKVAADIQKGAHVHVHNLKTRRW